MNIADFRKWPELRATNLRVENFCKPYFSAPLTSENVLLMPVPSAVSAPTKATAIRDAMRAYSIAVAPDISLENALMCFLIYIPNLHSYFARQVTLAP